MGGCREVAVCPASGAVLEDLVGEFAQAAHRHPRRRDLHRLAEVNVVGHDETVPAPVVCGQKMISYALSSCIGDGRINSPGYFVALDVLEAAIRDVRHFEVEKKAQARPLTPFPDPLLAGSRRPENRP